jgi:hypothetical protein
VIGRIEHDRLLLDLRTIAASDDEVLIQAVLRAAEAPVAQRNVT